MFYDKATDPLYRTNFTNRAGLPVLELKVPLCCSKCEEKVREELEDLEGVRDVFTDLYNQRVTVTGYVDPFRALKKVRKVKKKSDFVVDKTRFNNLYSGGLGGQPNYPIVVDGETRYTSNPLVRTSSFGRSAGYNDYYNDYNYNNVGGYGLHRSNSFGRRLDRLPSYGRPLQETYYGGGLSGGRNYRYDNFQPAYDVNRDYYSGIRRMPSFRKYRHHDAEYIAMDNQYTPYYGDSHYATPSTYSYADSHYVSRFNQRPSSYLRSQVSFSKLPVSNPFYLKHLDIEH